MTGFFILVTLWKSALTERSERQGNLLTPTKKYYGQEQRECTQCLNAGDTIQERFLAIDWPASKPDPENSLIEVMQS